MARIAVDEGFCKGCGLCVEACPKKILAMSKDKMNATGHHPAEMMDQDACIGCAFCATMCPDCIITVER